VNAGERADGMAPVTLRPATEADIPGCMEMFAELNRLQNPWRVFAPRSGLAGEMERHYYAALKDPDAALFLAEEDGAVVGMAAGHVHRPSSFSTDLAVELSSVYVRSGHRRRGIARALTAEVARFARGRGLDRITLKTFAQNREAVEAWSAMGFEPRALQMTAPVERLDHSPPGG
jgi:ribosomal protein S18 acetylase RimI-like enzyme